MYSYRGRLTALVTALTLENSYLKVLTEIRVGTSEIVVGTRSVRYLIVDSRVFYRAQYGH